jgi:hypothetical protein
MVSFAGYKQGARLKDIIDKLDPAVFPNAKDTIGKDAQLGRLNVYAQVNALTGGCTLLLLLLSAFMVGCTPCGCAALQHAVPAACIQCMACKSPGYLCCNRVGCVRCKRARCTVAGGAVWDVPVSC